MTNIQKLTLPLDNDKIFITLTSKVDVKERVNDDVFVRIPKNSNLQDRLRNITIRCDCCAYYALSSFLDDVDLTTVVQHYIDNPTDHHDVCIDFGEPVTMYRFNKCIIETIYRRIYCNKQ